MWEASKRNVDAIEKQLRPFVKLQKVHLKMEMAIFEEACNDYFKNDHQQAAFWKYETGAADAKEEIKDAKEVHKEKMEAFAKILHQVRLLHHYHHHHP